MNTEYYISEIKEINSRRRLVYINYEPAFALYASEIRKYQIKKGQELSQDSYYEITEELLPKRARIRAMNLLKSKDYAIEELRRKLKDNYYPESSIDTAIEYVSSYGYLNDERFVENYVAFKCNSKSRKQIEMFLKNKGIDGSLIREVCDQYYEEHSNLELDQAVKYLNKKIGMKDISSMDYSEKSKLSAYLYRHGFGMDIVKKALDIVVSGNQEY